MKQLLIENEGVIYTPVVPDDVTIEWERKQAGRLSFKVMKDGIINFTEGNPVKFFVDDTPLFYGFVFTKQRDKEGIIKVTAYDQLRYLKYKDTYREYDLTASEFILKIAGGIKTLNLGTIEDTKFVISEIKEDNQPYLDMVLSALDVTLTNTGDLFVLYDDFGKLVLTNVNNLKLDILIDDETGENFDYTSSIDSNTYNKIKLAFDNKDTGKRDIYTAQDGDHINKWGVLQYFEALNDPAYGKIKADGLLNLYNQKTRSLTVKGVFGDIRVRAGSALMVNLNLGDIVIGTYMMVEKVVHNFNEDYHSMDLTLRGGDYNF